LENKKLIYGRNPVLEYLKSGASPAGSILIINEKAHGKIVDEIAGEAKRRGFTIRRLPGTELSSRAPSSVHQGVILETIESADEREPDEGALLKKISASGGLIVLLEQLTDPHNVGSIIRSAEALGADAVAVTGARSAPISPSVIKSSAGATAHIKIIRTGNSAAFLDRAKEAGFWIAGTSDRGESKPEDLKTVKPCVVIIGSEGSGMKKLTEEKCDYIIRIPLKGRISSLNASVAAGIILYGLLADS
jgi:23S rRNA (guanosine2251-2'-O)-methyltransferase